MGKKRRHEDDKSETGSGSEDDSSSGSDASSGDDADSDDSSNRKHHKKHKKHHHHHKHHHKDKEKEKEKDKPLEKNEEEALEKLKNREATKKRSRMWQTVGDSDDSDSDDDDESGASSGDDVDKKGNGEASRDGSKRSASSERKKKDKKKDKHRQSKDRKKKKEKKHKKEHKKEKKHKKHKKSSKVAGSMMGAVDMNRYGKYGIIREADFSRKKHDFEVWLQETQSIPDIPRQKFEAMKLFRKYMEDYNTATFPHKKYYDVEKYEMDEYKRKQEKEAFRQLRKEGKFNDEQEHAAERRKSQTQKDREDFEWAMKMLNKDKIDAIKEQEHLKAKMQLAYRSGDMAMVKKIEYMLLPEEERQKMKRNTPADHLNM